MNLDDSKYLPFDIKVFKYHRYDLYTYIENTQYWGKLSPAFGIQNVSDERNARPTNIA